MTQPPERVGHLLCSESVVTTTMCINSNRCGSTDETVAYCVEISKIGGKAATSTFKLEPGFLQTVYEIGQSTEVYQWSGSF